MRHGDEEGHVKGCRLFLSRNLSSGQTESTVRKEYVGVHASNDVRSVVHGREPGVPRQQCGQRSRPGALV
jgi:hypothetical protein